MLRLSLIALVALVLLGGCKNRSNRPGDTLQCAPGESLMIGCTGTVGSACGGDPAMLACDGTVTPSACDDANALATNDDSAPGNLCPLVQTTCPASGRITVQLRGGTPSASFDCYWDIQHGGVHASDAGATETM